VGDDVDDHGSRDGEVGGDDGEDAGGGGGRVFVAVAEETVVAISMSGQSCGRFDFRICFHRKRAQQIK
jgi:hypothetical protein